MSGNIKLRRAKTWVGYGYDHLSWLVFGIVTAELGVSTIHIIEWNLPPPHFLEEEFNVSEHGRPNFFQFMKMSSIFV